MKTRFLRSPWVLPVLFLALVADPGRAGESLPNLPLPTLGGKQVWTDVAWHSGWRVQENALTRHCRLLDPANVRRAWGGREPCQRAFERHAGGLPLEQEHLVVLLHGLGRARTSFTRMGYALEADGYAVAALSYASTRASVVEHADRLEALLDGIEGPRRVSFVTHSLGGLVARELLSRDSAWSRRMRVERLVMIAPPSRGSALAERVTARAPLAAILGPSAFDATSTGAQRIPLPGCAFGIIAGGRGAADGWCPLVPGDDDGVVAVEEARLEGGAFLVTSGLHTFLPANADVISATRAFLARGDFRTVR